MTLAARRADKDAGGGLLGQVDRIDVVNLVSWRRADPPAELAARLGTAPLSTSEAPIDGETRTKFVHEAALAIALTTPPTMLTPVKGSTARSFGRA